MNRPDAEKVAIDFLEKLRPGGPWLLTAIIPDGSTTTITATSADDVRGFVSEYNGKQNLYYSVNPTRRPMRKKAQKTDIAAIEFLLSDLDPKEDETSEAAKARYLAELKASEPAPTGLVDSGNGIQVLLRLAEPIQLPEPVWVWVTNAKGERKHKKVYPAETQELIDGVENCVKLLMERLGGKAGTQNIDRILRLPGTINLPNAKKKREGRIACPTKLIAFNGATCRLEDFPTTEEPKSPGMERAESTSTKKKQELPARLAAMLVVPDKGAGEKHGKYDSRSGLLFGFLLGCLQDNVAADVMHNACLDETYRGKAIFEHCHEQGNDPVAYVERQIARAEEKHQSSISARIAPLLRLSMLEYEQQRKQVAKELNVRVSQLDRMVEGARSRDQKDDIDEDIAAINADYALVIAGNKAAMMKFDDKIKFRLLQVGAFRQWFANQTVAVGKKIMSLGDYWLSHPERRQYSGIEFAPPGSAAHTDYYNLFQGFAVEPKPGDCSKFLAHLKDNVARGDNRSFKWIVGWWAQIFQQPSIKMETALVLRGTFGAGKTKVGKVFGSLIGEHYLLAASSHYITGHFNSHMASLLVLHADEAFWAGDKASVGTLRDLVSGDVHMLEYKNVDAIRIKNFIRLFITGNPDWMVPAGFRERRWAVFDVGEKHAQDHAYFAAIDHEMNNGGREALLHYLLNFDLSQVDLRTIPKTAALLDQQIETMSPEEAWWFDTLMKGVLPQQPTGVEPRVCQKDELFERYILHTRIQGVRHRSIETKLGTFLRKQLGGKLKDIRPLVGTQRLRCYQLPPLADCRRLFSETLGQPVDWGSAKWANEEWHQGHYNWYKPLARSLL